MSPMNPLRLSTLALLIASTLAPSAPAADKSVPPAKAKFQLYILAGQSNMAGRGKVEEQDKTPHPRVLVFDKSGQWRPATEPLHFDKSAAGVGPGLAFGKAMADANPGVTIGLIPCAVGGTSLARWEAGAADPATKTHPYDDAMARIRKAAPDGVLMGMIWHQGEGDSGDKTAPVYAASLARLIERFRADLKTPDLRVVAGELGPFFVKKNPRAAVVNEQIRKLPELLKHTAAVTSENLTDKGDTTHFDAASAREFGKRYAAAMQKLVADK